VPPHTFESRRDTGLEELNQCSYSKIYTQYKGLQVGLQKFSYRPDPWLKFSTRTRTTVDLLMTDATPRISSLY